MRRDARRGSFESHAILPDDPASPGSCDDSHGVDLVIQADGRIRRWAPIREMGDRFLRVVLLPDGETIHNAFFDRSFEP